MINAPASLICPRATCSGDAAFTGEGSSRGDGDAAFTGDGDNERGDGGGSFTGDGDGAHDEDVDGDDESVAHDSAGSANRESARCP